MIPKTFHRAWFGGRMPKEFVRFGETWQEHHPDWEMVLWNEETLPPLRNQRLFDTAKRIAPQNVGQLRADIARYELLHQFGGVWIDCDFECRKPIDELLVDVRAFAAWEVDGRWINNAVMGAERGHPFFKGLIVKLPGSVDRNWGCRPNVMSGPQFLTWHWSRHPFDLTVFAQSLFYPYSFRELDRKDEEFPEAFAVHHWANRRRRHASR